MLSGEAGGGDPVVSLGDELEVVRTSEIETQEEPIVGLVIHGQHSYRHRNRHLGCARLD